MLRRGQKRGTGWGWLGWRSVLRNRGAVVCQRGRNRAAPACIEIFFAPEDEGYQVETPVRIEDGSGEGIDSRN